MRAQVTLTPSESKKLIAKAVVNLDVVKQALARGTVVIHPSSTTYFIIEEITGSKPKTDVWVCGVVIPKGTCIEMGTLVGAHSIVSEQAKEGALRHPEAFRYSWVVKGGEVSTGLPLGKILDELTSQDVYIKGANAIDVYGNVGILIGSAVEGGTIGRVLSASKKKGFSIIFPVGIEKLIPISVEEAAKEALKGDYEYSMGLPCALFPVKGIVVSEPKAIEILSGATAIPIAAGGLAGAEGSVTLVLKGDKDQVTKALEYIEQSKGAKLPPVRTFNCHECPVKGCFPVGDKPWVI